MRTGKQTTMQQPTRVYFDHAATTPLSSSARAAMEPYFTQSFGNASSPYAVSRTARMAIDRARGQVAALLGSHADELVWTSGGTEGDNWALLGVALREIVAGERGHIIVSAIEHHAVLEPAATLRDLGFEVEFARSDGNGIVHPEEIARLLRPETKLVSVMSVNNEVGTIQPVSAIASEVKAHSDALIHTDAVQAAGKIELDVNELGADLLTLSAHKFGGPKGCGVLWVRRGVKLHPFLRGGGQERGRRAGTENVPAIVGMGAAACDVCEELEVRTRSIQAMRTKLEEGVRELPGARINGKDAERAPHIVNVSLAGQRAESLALNLDMQGFAVGTGSACASGALEPSHVLAAMGRTKDEARASLRISLGVENTIEEIDEFLAVIRKWLSRRGLS
jgi:cysteine desulfurase